MNKKSIIAIAVLGLMLIGGIYYTVNEDKDQSEEDKIVQDEEKEEDEKKQEVSDEENEEADDEDIEDIGLEKGKPAPDFNLKSLDGEDVSLSDYKGKIVLINFWATWCTYCDQEMPDLEKLHNENKKDLVVLGIDVGEEEGEVRDYIEKGGYTFPVLLDKKMDVSRNKYYVGPLPTSYFIDKEGNLIGAVTGMMTYPQMNQILEQIKSGEI